MSDVQAALATLQGERPTCYAAHVRADTEGCPYCLSRGHFDAALATVEQALRDKDGYPVVLAKELQDERNRLREDVARLTAERDEARATRNVHSTSRRAAEAEVARLRDALRPYVTSAQRILYIGAHTEVEVRVPFKHADVARAALGEQA